jgi:hypothetical protein
VKTFLARHQWRLVGALLRERGAESEGACDQEPGGAAQPPPGWYPDPTGSAHLLEHRYSLRPEICHPAGGADLTIGSDVVG